MRPITLSRSIYRDLREAETNPRADEVHLSAAIDWLYRTQDVTDTGGSAAYYSLLTGWAGPYPETTGYIAPTLYDYATITESSRARNRAEKMATWLLETQLESGAFPSGTDPDPDTDPSVFNTGQILFGLVRAFRETGDDRFLDAVERAARWLVDVQHDEGYWDRFDYRGNIHSYCSRVAWALIEAYDVSGDDTYRDAAVGHLDWVASTQTDTDWFEYAAFSPDEVPYLHTIAYTTRGLLEAGIRLEDDSMVSTAAATADRLLECRDRNGPLRGAYDRKWTGSDYYCLTGNAQTAIIWLRLYEYGGEKRYLEAANAEIAFLKTHHLLDGPAPIQGAIGGSSPIWASYMRLRYPNWATKFFADALLTKMGLTGGGQ